MTRVSLSRLPGERALVVEDDAQHELALAELRRTSDRVRSIRRAGCGTTPRAGTRLSWQGGAESFRKDTGRW